MTRGGVPFEEFGFVLQGFLPTSTIAISGRVDGE
jgi:hypothetical protein